VLRNTLTLSHLLSDFDRPIQAGSSRRNSFSLLPTSLGFLFGLLCGPEDGNSTSSELHGVTNFVNQEYTKIVFLGYVFTINMIPSGEP
jgi:hypothetical protein